MFYPRGTRGKNTVEKYKFPVSEINDIMDIANQVTDTNLINGKILDLYSKQFNSEGSMFFSLQEDDVYRDTIRCNLDEKLNHDYKTYYQKFDPLHLMQDTKKPGPEDKMVLNVDYSFNQKSEYYTDFLAPQKIHYKLIAYLKTAQGIQAK